ncbi:MAG: DUF624 domain-containing protein [Bacillota bacterium]|jgi:uncharacterized membrane protein YesL|nr:DUF624 domain-containing protein [Bacillota bacterium]NLV64009.1 DUF624 domain-containing protein [Clostridiaceae bacterium]
MAGFFGLFDYTKEGPGVPKDAPPKARFIIFFEVLARKFWNIIKINLLFLIFNLPAILLLLLFAMYYNQLLLPQEILEGSGEELLGYLSGFTFPLMLIFICLPLITVGPAQAGMTYVLRNYSREEHAFIWGDFIEKAKTNFKQSMIVSVINTIITILVMVDIYIYMNIETDTILLTIASSLIIVAFLIFMMMSMYIYPMMVTFNLSIKQLYKNALLFAIMKFIPNLLILIVCFLVVIVPFYFAPFVGYILLIIITFGLVSYITNFYVYTKIDKYMIKRVNQSEEMTENVDQPVYEKIDESSQDSERQDLSE